MSDKAKQWWQKPSIKWLVCCVGTVASPLAVAALWWIFVQPAKLYQDVENPTKTELALRHRDTIIGGVGTIATVVGGVFLYLNFRVANKNAELSEDRLISERFAKAVEQLGHDDSIHIRLGGIYSLGQLAKDSEEMRKIVLNVLSAFVRETQLKKEEAEEAASNEETISGHQKLSADVQAALTVLWERKHEYEMIDLRNTSFKNNDLMSPDLSNAKLSAADLSYANLFAANLFAAQLFGADLSYADLSNAKLSVANLSYADLSNADLSNAKLNYAILLATDFRESKNLTKTQFANNYPPLLCNVALPQYIMDAEIDPNRDCKRLPQILSDRYKCSLEDAKEIVNDAQQKQWDEPPVTPNE